MPDSLIVKKMNDESGVVTLFSLFALVILTIAGIAAVTISNNETNIVRNVQLSSMAFYDAETGINDARVNHNNWILNLAVDPRTDSYIHKVAAPNIHGTSPMNVRIRCIEKTGTPVFDGGFADDVPKRPHKGPAPPGARHASGVAKFEARYYGLTSTSADNTVTVQAGVWKTLPKQ